MAGRGRPNTSLTHEQMSSLGLVAKDLSGQTITGPPPIFPQLMSKPVPLESGAARDYKILWKEDYISFLKDSPYYTHPTAVRDTAKVQRYSDKYVNSSKRDQLAGADFNWSRLPAELRPNYKRKPAAGQLASGKRKRTAARVAGANSQAETGLSVEEKLRKLEEKENGAEAKEAAAAAGGSGGDALNATRGAAAADSDADDDQLGEDEQQDEEMDDENDYGNSYFDNGDAYNEEDDNLDDGPVY